MRLRHAVFRRGEPSSTLPTCQAATLSIRRKGSRCKSPLSSCAFHDLAHGRVVPSRASPHKLHQNLQGRDADAAETHRQSRHPRLSAAPDWRPRFSRDDRRLAPTRSSSATAALRDCCRPLPPGTVPERSWKIFRRVRAKPDRPIVDQAFPGERSPSSNRRP